MLTPARSRTASRYESVATSRSPPAVAVSSTPVRIGRASSRDAAGTTWRSASANGAAASTVHARRRLTSGSRGKSSAGSVRSVVARTGRPRSAASSSPTSTVTAPARARGRCRNSRAGSTALPVALDLGRDLHPDRELEIGADQLDAVVADAATRRPGQHRERAGPGRDRPLAVRDGVGEGVALARNFTGPLSDCRPRCCQTDLLIVRSRCSRACGLGTTWVPRRWAPVWASTGSPPSSTGARERGRRWAVTLSPDPAGRSPAVHRVIHRGWCRAGSGRSAR